jgi:Rap1a immunity proteins
MLKFFAAIILIAYAGNAHADANGYTGNDLKRFLSEFEKIYDDRSETLSPDKALDAGIGIGLISGVGNVLSGHSIFCPPSSVTGGQVHDIVGKFLKNNPEHLHLNAVVLIEAALTKAFPCKK